MNVQVVDLKSEEFEFQFIQSLKETGFAVLINHGIDYKDIQDASKEWRQFFLSDEIHKKAFINHENPNMGFKPMRQETAVGAKTSDLKSFYHYAPGNRLPPNTWAITLHLFQALDDIGQKLLQAIDKDDPGKNYAESCWESDQTLFRSLYYPALDFCKEPDAVRAAAHEDINMLTLLVAASAPGLEVLDRNGNWLAVPFEQNSIIVNVGDSLQLASDGKYKSTTHRVVNPKDNTSDRVSMPLFIGPHNDTVLAPGVIAKQYLDERLEQIYGSKK